ncbi:MAG: hypothetical protein EBX56_11075 [Betaproteobacteria bacterium]|nr:hypothetical protein [Betaproteobacteria bacterium]
MLLLTQAHSRRIPAKLTTHPIISIKAKDKKRISASDDSERLSEARHHAAQGKAFALSTLHTPHNVFSKRQTDQ